MSSLLYLMLILRCGGINLGIFHSVDAQFNTPVLTNLIIFDSLSMKNISAYSIGSLPGLFYKRTNGILCRNLVIMLDWQLMSISILS